MIYNIYLYLLFYHWYPFNFCPFHFSNYQLRGRGTVKGIRRIATSSRDVPKMSNSTLNLLNTIEVVPLKPVWFCFKQRNTVWVNTVKRSSLIHFIQSQLFVGAMNNYLFAMVIALVLVSNTQEFSVVCR